MRPPLAFALLIGLATTGLAMAGAATMPSPTQLPARQDMPASRQGRLPHIAAVGLCADQMAIMLAAPGQIAAVSAQATGPLSFYAKQARTLPSTRGSAEEIIASGADILLVSDMMDTRSAQALASFGVKIITVPLVNSWAEIEDMTRTIAKAIGRRERGEAVVADMRRRLAHIRPAEEPEAWPSVIYYRPDGGGAGEGTFVDEALTSAGFRNLQRQWGPPSWSGVPVEKIVTTPPDAFAVSYFDTNDRASAILRRNPVLWGSARTRPVISVPGKYWNCGSPLLIEAAEMLRTQRDRLMRQHPASQGAPRTSSARDALPSLFKKSVS